MRPWALLTFRFFCKPINVFPRCVACVLLHAYFLCARTLLLCTTCAGKSHKGKLVNSVEKTSFEKIRKLLEISERELHHEVLLTLKNLGDLSRNPSPYNILVIPRPPPIEILEGEHYIIVDLLNLLPGSLSPAREQETEVAGRELVILT